MSTEMSGRGDPARTLTLLWRTAAPPARGPRPGLDVDRIVAVAVEIADTHGLAAVSMRRVAERLGVGTMSLYTYVPGKAELIDLMLDVVLGEVARPPHTGGWRESLTRVARENWALAHRHPWMLYVAVGRPLAGPHETAKFDHELRAVDGVGLGDVEMDAALRLVLGHAYAAARASVDKTRAEQESGLTDAQWWQRLGPLLPAKVADGDFTVAARVAQAVGEAFDAASDPEYAFEFGLHRILDGIEALLAARGRSGTMGR